MDCIIIDDDQVQRHLLSSYIKDLGNIELLGEFENATGALQFLQRHQPEIIFLDVEMPGMNGVEFLEQFKPKSHIVLISSEEKYAINGFQLEVSDYLLKPISFARFTRSIQRISEMAHPEHVDSDSNDFLFIKDKGVYQKIQFQEIQFIQSSSEYVTIHTPVKKVMLYSSMDGILNKLPQNFMRVHRSFIVNLNAIDRVNGNTVEIKSNSISVSKTYHEDLMKHLGLRVK